MAVRTKKIAPMQSDGGGTVHTPAHIIFSRFSKSQRADGRAAWRMKSRKIVHMKRPAKRMPMAMRTPTALKPGNRSDKRKKTNRVVKAPQNSEELSTPRRNSAAMGVSAVYMQPRRW